MPTRLIVLALSLLIFAPLAGRTAEQAGTTVVLQLPPSMSPDQVRGLIADLAAKGAQPAAPSSGPPVAASPRSPSLMTGAHMAAQIWEATKQAMRAVPALFQAPQVWVQRVEAEGGTPDAAIRFWAISLAVLLAAPFIGSAARALFDRRRAVAPGLGPRLRAAFIKLLVAAIGVSVFAFLFGAALMAMSMGRPILAETADRLVWAALQWRLSIVLLSIVLSRTGRIFGCCRSTMPTRRPVPVGSGSI